MTDAGTGTLAGSEVKGGAGPATIADKAMQTLVDYVRRDTKLLLESMRESAETAKSKKQPVEPRVVCVTFKSAIGSSEVTTVDKTHVLSRECNKHFLNNRRIINEVLYTRKLNLDQYLVIFADFVSIDPERDTSLPVETYSQHWAFVPFHVLHPNGHGKFAKGGLPDLLDQDTYDSKFWSDWDETFKGDQGLNALYPTLMGCTHKLGAWRVSDEKTGDLTWLVQGGPCSDPEIARHSRAMNAELRFAAPDKVFPPMTTMTFVAFEKLKPVAKLVDHDPHVDGQLMIDSKDEPHPTPPQKNRRAVVTQHYNLCSALWRSKDAIPGFMESDEFRPLPAVSHLFVDFYRHGLPTALFMTQRASKKATGDSKNSSVMRIVTSAGSCTLLASDANKEPILAVLRMLDDYARDSGCSEIVVTKPSFAGVDTDTSPMYKGWEKWAHQVFVKTGSYVLARSPQIWAKKSLALEMA